MIFTRNRYAKVRGWAPGVGGLAARDYVSPCYIVQQPHVRNGWQARLDPVGEEWWKDRRGRHHKTRDVQEACRLVRNARRGAPVFPALLSTPIRRALVMACGVMPFWLGDPGVSLAAMLGFYSNKKVPHFFGGAVGTGTTDSTQLLDAAMSFGASGDAFAVGFNAPGKTVESALFFATAVGATNSMSCRLRTRGAALPVNPAVEETTGVNFSSTGWNEIASFATALTYGTQYYMSLEDGAASTADVTVQTTNNRLEQSAFSLEHLSRGMFWGTVTTNGYSTQSTLQGATAIVTFSDGTALGNPISGSATQNVAQKGVRWIGGPTEDLDVYGVIESDIFAASAFTTGQIWTGTNGPGGSSADDSTKVMLNNNASGIHGWLTNAFPYRMTGGTDYRVTHFDNAAFTTGARKYSIGTVVSGTLADLQYCLPFGGDWYWTNESGGAWADDDTGYPGLVLLVEDQVAISGGAGGNANILGGSVVA